MFFWHVAATIAITRYSFRDERMDLRFLILGAVLPDLIDTPLGLAGFSRLESVRLISHSLLFAGIAMMWIVLATRRGRPRKKWMPIAIGILIHLFLDTMWANPETLWWPVLGGSFTPDGASSAGDYVAAVLQDPWVWLGEAVGFTYLAVMARRAGLGQGTSRRLFRETGQINVPIGT
ncbi:MAG: metal-dependent hydrolase [bacterium]|nr:metal-dependent hydrolase [bacterium]